jgi:hypothetical protein
MFTADEFRAKAAGSAESAKNTDIPGEIRKFQASMENFRLLAQNEDWLADFLHNHKDEKAADLITKPNDGRTA